MYTVSIIIRQQPELTSRLKEKTDSFIKSLVSLYGDMEFLFSEKGEFEKCLLSSVDKVRKERDFQQQKVIVTLASEAPIVECCWDGIFFDRVAYFPCTEKKEPWHFLPIHRHMMNRSDMLVYYADIFNKESEDLVRYVKCFGGSTCNLAD